MAQSYRTGDQALVREINLSTVLRSLQTSAPLSRTGVASLTGLNKTTVSSLVEELIARGLVREIGLDMPSGGRPATLLELNSTAGVIVGVELGVDFIAAVLGTLTGQILWRRLQEADQRAGQEAMIAQTLRLVDEAIAAPERAGARLLGVGLATPGTVNVRDGLLIFSPNLQWRNVPFGQIFHQHTGLPVLVDNDANAAAMGEHLFGVGRQVDDFILIFAGVGIGGGLFLRGELYRGASGYAGEIGHTNFMVEPYRPPCRCGNRGCWETFANQYALTERMRARLEVGRYSLVSRLMTEQHAPLSISLIVEAADAGDAEALEALTETGYLMGLGVANLVNIFNPELIILGGPLSVAGAYYLPAIEEAVRRTALPEIQQQVQIVLSGFGADASLIGAVALVAEAVLANPSGVEG